jgi:membrane protease YdiL (CAAX protease family)
MWAYFLAAFVCIASLSKKARPLAAAGIGILVAGPVFLLAVIVFLAFIFAGTTGDPRQMTAAGLVAIVYLALPAILVIGGVAGLFWFLTGRIAWAGSKPSRSWSLLVFVFFAVGFGVTLIWWMGNLPGELNPLSVFHH